MDTLTHYVGAAIKKLDDALSNTPLPFDPWIAQVIAATLFVCATIASLHPSWVSVMNRSRNVSTLHSVVVVTLCAAAYGEVAPILFDPSGAIWTARGEMTTLVVCITTGYILFDSLLGLAFPGQLDAPMWIHHLVVLACFLSGLAYGVGVPFCALFLINEASTIPLNFHFQWCGRQRNWVRTVNGAALWLSYLLCRMVANAFLSASVYTTSAPAVRAAYPVVWALQICVLSTLTVLNCMWFYKISRGFFKAISGGSNSSSKTSSSNNSKAAAPVADADAAESSPLKARPSSLSSEEAAPLTPSDDAHSTASSVSSSGGASSDSSTGKLKKRQKRV